MLGMAVLVLLLSVATAQDPIADMRKHELAPHAGHHRQQHSADSNDNIIMGGGGAATRKLLHWGRHHRAYAQAGGMYWAARGWRGPSIPSQARMETATQRQFARAGAW